MIKTLSFIIPTFHQEKTILEDIEKLEKTLINLKIDFEIIVVADGLLKEVLAITSKIKDKRIKVIGYEKNQGKGNAVKYGILNAEGDVIGFIDAGLDLDPKVIINMLKIMEQKNADIVIGSKVHPNSNINYPLFRKVLSSGYRFFIHTLFDINVKDTQAGLKIFKKKAAKEIFSKIKTKGFAFDIESLVIAKKLGYNKVYEAPIRVNYRNNTINYFNSIKIVSKMLIETFSIFIRLKSLDK